MLRGDTTRKMAVADLAAPSGREKSAVALASDAPAQVALPLVQEGAAVPVVERPMLPLFAWNIPLPSSLRALRHQNFRLFWTGQLISLIGTWMQTIARGWLVLEVTHSPFWLGMVGFATAAPVLLLSLWGGSVADRVAKRQLIIVTQILQMVLAFVLGALTLLGMVQLWHILAISVALGIIMSFDAPARQSFTVEMVGKDDLMNAVALNSSVFNGARVLGPAIGALVLAWAGSGWAFMLNGVSYLAVIYGLYRMTVPDHPYSVGKAKSKDSVLDGLRYLKKDSTIAACMGIIAVISIFAFPYTVLMPIFADSVLRVGQQGYGTLMMFGGIGSLIGALSLTLQSGKDSAHRGRTVLAGVIGLPISLALFSLSNNYLVSLLMLVGVGYCMIAISATINTIIQTNVPDELRGRVNGVYALLFMGVAPFGNLQSGMVADRFGAPAALFVGAVAVALLTLFLLIKKRKVFAVS